VFSSEKEKNVSVVIGAESEKLPDIKSEVELLIIIYCEISATRELYNK